MEKKKLGLKSVIATGAGLIVATSCLMSLGQGAGSVGCSFIIAMIIACILNLITAASLAELNSLMPNLTGGLAQYTLACLGPFPTIVSMVGGYLVCNSLSASVEGAMFGNCLVTVTGTSIPPMVFTIGITIILIIANLQGVDMFAKIQDIVAYGLIISLVMMGLIGAAGIGTQPKINQQFNLITNWKDIIPMIAAAFWLFIGVEFIIPISKEVKNFKKNIPRGMFLSLLIVCGMQCIIVFGFHNYTYWNELAESPAPHILYGHNLLGNIGVMWMGVVSTFAAVSTLNSVLNSLANICRGMAKINMLPSFFQKTNKKGAPVAGILFIGGIILLVDASGLSSTEQLSFIILTGSVFWMISYIIAHINVLVLKNRLPKAPRSFKVPFGPLLPIIGITGTAFMIININSDPLIRMKIWTLTGITMIILSIYAVLWIKFKMKIPVFKHIPLSKVMAMENEMYYITHKKLNINHEKIEAERCL